MTNDGLRNSMDACMPLIDEMTKHGRQLTIEFSRFWEAYLYSSTGSPICATRNCKTLPEAMCHLYLVWKEGE